MAVQTGDSVAVGLIVYVPVIDPVGVEVINGESVAVRVAVAAMVMVGVSVIVVIDDVMVTVLVGVNVWLWPIAVKDGVIVRVYAVAAVGVIEV